MTEESPETKTPLNDQDLFTALTALGIETRTVDHEAAFTVEQAQAHRGMLEGAHIKNLFLRDKKKTIWLVTVLEDRAIDLKALRPHLGAKGNLSFGSPDLLMDRLGVIPGAVTPFGILNDHDGLVQVVLDKAIFDEPFVNAHPLRNDQTTQIKPDDLIQFLEDRNHAPLILDFDQIGGDT